MRCAAVVAMVPETKDDEDDMYTEDTVVVTDGRKLTSRLRLSVLRL